MSRPASPFRLSNNMFDRKDDAEKISPKRVIFLSVEGSVTEPCYFSHLNKKLDHSIVHVEVLHDRKRDHKSDPLHVAELLQEVAEIRERGYSELLAEKITEQCRGEYSADFIERLVDDEELLQKIDSTDFEVISQLLQDVKRKIQYLKYLQEFNAGTDYFAVVIDRDEKSHSEEDIRKVISDYSGDNKGCYLTNPCFEFWLLLHLQDVHKECSEDEQMCILKNEKISRNHTYVSGKVSEIAGHSKNISESVFNSIYYPNIQAAISRSEKFASTLDTIIDQLGTNLPDLIRLILDEEIQ